MAPADIALRFGRNAARSRKTSRIRRISALGLGTTTPAKQTGQSSRLLRRPRKPPPPWGWRIHRPQVAITTDPCAVSWHRGKRPHPRIRPIRHSTGPQSLWHCRLHATASWRVASRQAGEALIDAKVMMLSRNILNAAVRRRPVASLTRPIGSHALTPSAGSMFTSANRGGHRMPYRRVLWALQGRCRRPSTIHTDGLWMVTRDEAGTRAAAQTRR